MFEQKPHLPTLAILGGTGKEGPGLAMRWALAGYPVIIGSRQAEKAEATAAELRSNLGLENIQGMENCDAVHAAEICVLTVVQTAHREILENLQIDLKGKILVDATARVDFRSPKPPTSPSAARMAQNKLGKDVCVVAAFQNVPSTTLKNNPGQPLDVDVLVCSDDIPAAELVIDLAQAAGMQAFYAGDLDNAVVVEGLTSILISMNKYYRSHNASIRVVGLDR